MQILFKKERRNIMDSYISGEIKKGDLILVLDNRIRVGFYLGAGSGTSQRYYNINCLCRWNDSDKRRKPSISNIWGNTVSRMIKYSPDLLSGEMLKSYEKALEALKLLNI